MYVLYSFTGTAARQAILRITPLSTLATGVVIGCPSQVHVANDELLLYWGQGRAAPSCVFSRGKPSTSPLQHSKSRTPQSLTSTIISTVSSDHFQDVKLSLTLTLEAQQPYTTQEVTKCSLGRSARAFAALEDTSTSFGLDPFGTKTTAAIAEIATP